MTFFDLCLATFASVTGEVSLKNGARILIFVILFMAIAPPMAIVIAITTIGPPFLMKGYYYRYGHKVDATL